MVTISRRRSSEIARLWHPQRRPSDPRHRPPLHPTTTRRYLWGQAVGRATTTGTQGAHGGDLEVTRRRKARGGMTED
jgi:hypothetical protein